MWRNPELTAAELHELIPRHTPKAIRNMRGRVGRYRREGVVPLCQRCGEHPVNERDPVARRWGLCRECAEAEKDWRERNGRRLERAATARRQRAWRRRHGNGGE